MIAGAVAGGALLLVARLVERASASRRRRLVVARVTPVPRAARRRSLPRLPAPAPLAAAIERADLAVAAADVWTAWVVVCGCVLPVVAAGAGAAAAVVLAAVLGAAPAGTLAMLGHRAAARYEAALPGALEAIARALRSGASIQLAVAEAAVASPGAIGVDLDRVATAAAAGVPFADALATWSVRRPSAGVRLTVAALSLGSDAGGATARAIDGVAATLRERLAVVAELRALASQAKASAAVLVAAPVVFCVLASIADPATADTLLRTPLGLACLVAGLGLDAVGALWMRRIVRAVA